MVTKCCNISTIGAVTQANHTEKPAASNYRISTKALSNLLFGLNTTAAAIACYYNPGAALAGGILGAAVRHMVGDNPQAKSMTEDEKRANQLAMMCLSTVATIYTGASYVSPTECSVFAPFFLGFEGIVNGLYPIARKVVG